MIESDLCTVLAIEKLSFPVPWKREHFLHEITAPHSFPLVADYNGMVIGYVCLTSLYEVAEILDIAVDPEQRGKGIAFLLMVQATLLAKKNGAEVLALEVRETNLSAISLYQRLGFTRKGCRSKYYENRDDAVLMEKNLKETI
jgi:ribosomal-protein-alanine N-acetyltransferase